MSVSKIAGLMLSSAAMVAGHGFVSGAVVDGTYYGGYLVNNYPYNDNHPETIGWAEKATDLGFVDATGYSGPDIICHKEATPGAISAEVKAGGDVELQWTEWPESHHGPVINYLANCNGDCSKVDKTTLKWFKIAESGLIDGSNAPGKWASDELIANNNSASVTIPSSIAAGNYVLRHEIIALHSAGQENGAQNYPQCLNLKVTGGGSDKPEGVVGTELYKANDAGILVSIYNQLKEYTIPGPALYKGASSGSTTTAAPSATTTSASTVSASPIQSSSHHITRTRTARPTYSPSGTPTPSSSATSAVSTSTPLGSGSEPTETPTAIASSAPQVTDEPATQTASEPTDSVSITTSAGAQSAQSSVPAAGGQAAEPSATPSSSSTGSSSGSSSSSSSSSGSTSESGDYATYLSSLSAEKLLEVIRSTLKWLVSDNKVHARALTH